MSVIAPTGPSASLRHIYASGEMADLTRRLDWSATPVGPVEDWPETLLVTVNTLLASRQPMFLWWGSELTQFYNDAYRPSLGVDSTPAPSVKLPRVLAGDLARYRPSDRVSTLSR